MKWKKGLLSVLASTMLAGISLAGCSSGGSQKSAKGAVAANSTSSNFNKTGLPIVKKKLTLTVAGQYSPSNGSSKWNEKSVFQDLEKKTNIHVNWQLTPLSGWQQKKNLLLASGNLPDVLLDVNTSDVTKYGPQGEFIPLEGLINKYAPNLKKILKEHPEIRKEITAPDGHIYSLPTVFLAHSIGTPHLWINKKWLDNLGLKMPRTTKQFKKVLEAFKNKDPNENGKHDEIPYLHLYNANAPLYVNPVCKAFGVVITRNIDPLVRNGKVSFPAAQPGYKGCINYYHSLYKEGLINKDFATITWDQFLARTASGNKATVGAFLGNDPVDDVPGRKYSSEYVAVPPLKGPNGQRLVPKPQKSVNQSSFVITSADKHPKATMRWVDQAYAKEMSYKIVQGPNRIKKLSNGKYKRVIHPDGISIIKWRYKESPVDLFVYYFDQKMQDNLILPSDSLAKKKLVYFKKYIKPNATDVYYPPVMFTANETNEINGYKTQIQKFVVKMTAQWTVHGGVDQGWNGYLQKLKGMGLQNMLKVYQKAYDRYNSH